MFLVGSYNIIFSYFLGPCTNIAYPEEEMTLKRSFLGLMLFSQIFPLVLSLVGYFSTDSCWIPHYSAFAIVDAISVMGLSVSMNLLSSLPMVLQSLST